MEQIQVSEYSALSPSEFINKLNLNKLPENAANYIRENILTEDFLSEVSADNEAFDTFRSKIIEKYPGALLPDDEDDNLDIEPTPEPVVEEVELTVDDYITSIEGSFILLEIQTGDEKQDTIDYIDGLLVMVVTLGGETKKLEIQFK